MSPCVCWAVGDQSAVGAAAGGRARDRGGAGGHSRLVYPDPRQEGGAQAGGRAHSSHSHRDCHRCDVTRYKPVSCTCCLLFRIELTLCSDSPRPAGTRRPAERRPAQWWAATQGEAWGRLPQATVTHIEHIRMKMRGSAICTANNNVLPVVMESIFSG